MAKILKRGFVIKRVKIPKGKGVNIVRTKEFVELQFLPRKFPGKKKKKRRK